MRGVVTEVLGSRHYIVRVAGNLWKRHIDQLLRHPADVALTRGFLASDCQSMPLDIFPDMDQPYEIVPHSIIPSTYIPSTAILVVQPNSRLIPPQVNHPHCFSWAGDCATGWIRRHPHLEHMLRLANTVPW